MLLSYSFEDPRWNTLLLLVLWVWFCAGIYLTSLLSYKIYQKELSEDPDFNKAPINLRWKVPLLILSGAFLAGPPVIISLFSAAYFIFYLLVPVLADESFKLIPYITTIGLYVLYLKFFAKRLQNFMYLRLKKHFDFEKYFRRNTKAWGLMNEGETNYVNEHEYVRLAQLGKIMLHFGLIPLTLIVLSSLLDGYIMEFISIVTFIIFSYINITAFVTFSDKARTMSIDEKRKNENYVYFRWMGLLIINTVILLIPHLFNLYFQVPNNQQRLDMFATGGFIFLFILTPLLYLYQYRYKHILNINHSIGIVFLYVLQIVFMTASCLYFVIG